MMLSHQTGQQEVLGDRVLVEETNVAEPVVQETIPSSSEAQPGAQAGEIQPAVRPSIDEMIQQLQREQDQRLVAEGLAPLASPPPVPLSSPNPRAGPSRSNSGMD